MKPIAFLAVLCLLLPAAAFGQAAPAQKNRLTNGDFEEAPGKELPAPGWGVWGDSAAKNPDDFKVVADNPHGGKACLKIHHPSDKHAYIVTDPKTPIKTSKGKAYIITFWARAEKADPGVFYLEAASDLPWKEVSATLRWPLAATKEWKEYKFQVDEGKDFRADEVKYVLLAIRATRDKKSENTLWIDDVVVAEVDALSEPLVDEKTLKAAPLNHRLEAGDKFALKIDGSKRIGEAAAQAGGMSFHRVSGSGRHPFDPDGKWILEPELTQALKDMKLPMTRYYAVGAEKYPVNDSIDKVAEICAKCDIPQEWVVLELEGQGAEKRIEPADWAKAVKHSVDKGYKFRLWEVANEPYTRKATAFANQDDYAAHLKAVSAAVKAVQKDAQIGMGIHPADTAWGNYLLKKTAGSYDFVVGHYYSGADPYKLNFSDTVISENIVRLKQINRLNALIKEYNPKGNVYQLDTEWGLGGGRGDDDANDYRAANVEGAVYRAVRMIYYAREGMMRGASGWEMFSRIKHPTFGVLTRDDKDARYMLYWVYYLFNRHVGKYALDFTGTAPFYAGTGDFSSVSAPITPTLATISEDGRTMYLVIANGSWDKAQPCTASLAGFKAASAEGVALSQPGQDDNSLVKMADMDKVMTKLDVAATPDKLTFTVPAHSAVFIAVKGN
jgi:hypothetical protein